MTAELSNPLGQRQGAERGFIRDPLQYAYQLCNPASENDDPNGAPGGKALIVYASDGQSVLFRANDDGVMCLGAPTGLIAPWAGDVTKIPRGWLLCNGQAVSRTAYAELFALIGTAYGAGDGSTTFNVPDLRDAVPGGVGSVFGTRGGVYGTNTATVINGAHAHGPGSLQFKVDISHRHDVSLEGATEIRAVGVGYRKDGSQHAHYGQTDPISTQTWSIDRTGQTDSAGINTSVSPLQRTVGVHYIIKARG